MGNGQMGNGVWMSSVASELFYRKSLEYIFFLEGAEDNHLISLIICHLYDLNDSYCNIDGIEHHFA